MTDLRWLDNPRNPAEAELRKALDEAQERASDEVALRRVWGKVQYAEPVPEPRRPRWFWFVGGVATSAVLTVALVFGLATKAKLPATITTRTVDTAPAAIAAMATPEVREAVDREAINNGRREAVDEAAGEGERLPRLVRTAAGETMRLSLSGGVEASVGARSVLNLTGKERPSVDHGEVRFKVPRQAAGKTFSIDVGPYRVVVIGTNFRLRHQGRRVTVEVDEGTVEIWRGRRLARLTAGESWAGPTRDREVLPTRARPVLTQPNVAGATVARKAGVSSVSSPSSSSSWGTPAAPPVETQPPTPWPSLVAPAAAAPAPAAATPAVRALPQPPAAAGNPIEARAALAAGDFHRALELYRGIRARGGPAAENAEYEIGMILRDRLKRPNKAIATWRRYRAEHPEGLLRVETDVSIIETLVSGGENEAALAEAQEFLRRHPNSERRAEIAGVAGDLYRTAGECGRAVNAYDVALGTTRTSKITDSATFHRAVCLMALNQDEGRAGLRVYLRDFANGRHRDQATRLLQGIDRGTP